MYLIQHRISVFHLCFQRKELNSLQAGKRMHWNQLSLCQNLDLFFLTVFLIYPTFSQLFFLVFFRLGNFFYFHIRFSSSLVSNKIFFIFFLCFGRLFFFTVSLFINCSIFTSPSYFEKAIGQAQTLSFDLEVILRTKQENGWRMIIGCTGSLVKSLATFLYSVGFSLVDLAFQSAYYDICLLIIPL